MKRQLAGIGLLAVALGCGGGGDRAAVIRLGRAGAESSPDDAGAGTVATDDGKGNDGDGVSTTSTDYKLTRPSRSMLASRSATLGRKLHRGQGQCLPVLMCLAPRSRSAVNSTWAAT